MAICLPTSVLYLMSYNKQIKPFLKIDLTDHQLPSTQKLRIPSDIWYLRPIGEIPPSCYNCLSDAPTKMYYKFNIF